MNNAPDVWWPSVVLAVVLFLDAVLSMRPPAFIRNCLQGVGFPQDWWWTLVVIKLLAVAGLLAGLRFGGIGLAANVGVVVYFLCAVYAHIRARFLGSEFWLNCLGLLLLSTGVLVITHVI